MGTSMFDFRVKATVFSSKLRWLPGKQIPDNRMVDFEEYIADTLQEWLPEGVDDLPSSIYDRHRNSGLKRPPRET